LERLNDLHDFENVHVSELIVRLSDRAKRTDRLLGIDWSLLKYLSGDTKDAFPNAPDFQQPVNGRADFRLRVERVYVCFQPIKIFLLA
jgi:hypothetical protein